MHCIRIFSKKWKLKSSCSPLWASRAATSHFTSLWACSEKIFRGLVWHHHSLKIAFGLREHTVMPHSFSRFVYTRRRWPLFSPMIFITDWFSTYSSLIESTFCLTCIYQMAEDIPDDLDSQPLRQKRLGHDLRGLLSDASEGIRAKPLDSSYYHWQASITGMKWSKFQSKMILLL